MPPRELALHIEQRLVRRRDDPIARELYSHCLQIAIQLVKSYFSPIPSHTIHQRISPFGKEAHEHICDALHGLSGRAMHTSSFNCPIQCSTLRPTFNVQASKWPQSRSCCLFA